MTITAAEISAAVANLNPRARENVDRYMRAINPYIAEPSKELDEIHELMKQHPFNKPHWVTEKINAYVARMVAEGKA